MLKQIGIKKKPAVQPPLERQLSRKEQLMRQFEREDALRDLRKQQSLRDVRTYDLDLSLAHQPQKLREPKYQNIHDVLSFDSKILSFANCIPTKMLG